MNNPELQIYCTTQIKKILALSEKLNSTFNSQNDKEFNEEYLKIAIRAGLMDAYSKGNKDTSFPPAL